MYVNVVVVRSSLRRKKRDTAKYPLSVRISVVTAACGRSKATVGQYCFPRGV